jgi:poly(3-hydroxybutyrate) depolymerase
MRISLAFATAALCCLAKASAKASAECDAEWPSSGCLKQLPSGEKPGQVYNKTIVSNGVLRSYLVFLPPKYQPNPRQPHPTIFSYHGGVQTAQDQLELDLFTSPYFNNESMVVYPQGINVSASL